MKQHNHLQPVQGRSAPRRLQSAVGLLALALPVLLACESEFHSAHVAGFVKHALPPPSRGGSAPARGVNEVEVRIFLDEPASFLDEGAVAHTVTAPNRSVGEPLDGYYSHRIAWESDSSDFGRDADSRSIWIATRHDDFHDRVQEFTGVLSDSVNILPDIALEELFARPGEVSGRVLLDGSGHDGVRIVLDLDVDGSIDHEARSSEVDGRSGVYVFSDVAWPGDEGDARTALLLVDDPEYGSAQELEIELTAGEPFDVAPPFEIYPAALAVSSITGSVVNTVGHGVAGVRVHVTGDGAAGARTWMTTSGATGEYVFDPFVYLPGDSAGGTATLMLSVDDERYEQITNGGDPVAVVVASERETVVPEPIVVERKPRTMFSARVTGRCIERIEVQSGDVREIPLGGVVVELAIEDENGPRTLVGQSNAEGQYEFYVEWNDGEPDPSAPGGEDMLDVTVQFSELRRGDDTLTFEPLTATLRSWVSPNLLPDAIGAP